MSKELIPEDIDRFVPAETEIEDWRSKRVVPSILAVNGLGRILHNFHQFNSLINFFDEGNGEFDHVETRLEQASNQCPTCHQEVYQDPIALFVSEELESMFVNRDIPVLSRPEVDYNTYKLHAQLGQATLEEYISGYPNGGERGYLG